MCYLNLNAMFFVLLLAITCLYKQPGSLPPPPFGLPCSIKQSFSGPAGLHATKTRRNEHNFFGKESSIIFGKSIDSCKISDAVAPESTLISATNNMGERRRVETGGK